MTAAGTSAIFKARGLRTHFETELRRLQSETGTFLVLITHDLGVIEALK